MQYEEIVALFPDYLEGKLSESKRQRVDDAVNSSSDLQTTLEILKELKEKQLGWSDEDIPNWHRSAYLPRPRTRQIHWMNWFSMASSFAAVLLVVFQVTVTRNHEGFIIGFSQSQQQHSMEQSVEAYLDNWKIEQTRYIDNRLLEFENHQLLQNQQVLTSALEYNRDQRRQDLNQLTSYFLQQRSSDLNKSQTQFKILLDTQLEDRQAINTLYASIDK